MSEEKTKTYIKDEAYLLKVLDFPMEDMPCIFGVTCYTPREAAQQILLSLLNPKNICMQNYIIFSHGIVDYIGTALGYGGMLESAVEMEHDPGEYTWDHEEVVSILKQLIGIIFSH